MCSMRKVLPGRLPFSLFLCLTDSVGQETKAVKNRLIAHIPDFSIGRENPKRSVRERVENWGLVAVAGCFQGIRKKILIFPTSYHTAIFTSSIIGKVNGPYFVTNGFSRAVFSRISSGGKMRFRSLFSWKEETLLFKKEVFYSRSKK